MRCGGPGLCQTCAQEAAALAAAPSPVPAQEPVGHVYTMEALVPGGIVRHHAQMYRALPAGTKLYAAPVGQAEDAARLEWLHEKLSGLDLVMRFLFGSPDASMTPAEFRSDIDAARAQQAVQPQPGDAHG